MTGWPSIGADVAPVLAAAIAIVALLRGRRWIFLAWAAVRPAAWPAFWGLLLVTALGMTEQGRALVQRSAEVGQMPLLLAVCLGAGALMGYASASLLFVRYEPTAASLGIVARQIWPQHDERDRRWEAELGRRCDRLRRVFPVLVAALPLVALLPAAAAQRLPTMTFLPGLAPFAAIAGILLLAWSLARTRLLRAGKPPRRRWLWPLRYPELSDAGIEQAAEAAAGPRQRRGRVGDALLGGMLPGTRWAFNLAWAMGAACFVAAWLAPIAWSQQLGTATIVTAAVAAYAVLGALAAYWINRRFSVSIPYALGLALLAAGLFARWGVSDNHAVRSVADDAARAAEEARVRSRPTFEEQLAAWIEARELRQPPAKGAPYPLVVAAAQGGGIRAALWTALALGGLQQRIPTFSCDLFAVTAVSGGSLGALTYAAMLDRMPPSCWSKRPVEPGAARAADRYLAAAASTFGGDLLGPVAAGLFFPDLLQRFLPWPLLPDRQTYLELGWEEAWAHHAGVAGRLDSPFLSLFPATAAGKRPVLMLIASEVEGGRRWIASNARIDHDMFADAVDTLAGTLLKDDDSLEEKPVQALPASAAAGLSARFPYISPPGRLDVGGGSVDLLDGGIVESSGAATAGEILLFLRSQCDGAGREGVLACRVEDVPADPARNRRATKDVKGCGKLDEPGCVHIRPALVQITNDAWTPAADAPDGDWRDALLPRFPELLSPIRGLLASRTGRGRGAHDRLQGDPFLLAGESCLDLDIVLDGADPAARVPLGWTLRDGHVAGMTAKMGDLLAKGPLEEKDSQVDFARWRTNVYERPADQPCAGQRPREPLTTAANAAPG